MTRRKRDGVPTLAVNLMLAGRPCLVVGGGRVALRKIERLLDAQASVTVVAPTVVEGVQALADAGALALLLRPFEGADVDGHRLVFAATNDLGVNRRVLAACQVLGILCGAVDRQWDEGDFILPAAFTTQGVQVAVSSGGKSPRRVKAIGAALRDYLSAGSLLSEEDDVAGEGEAG